MINSWIKKPPCGGESEWNLVCHKSKRGQQHVRRFAPALDLATGERPEWADRFVHERDGLEFIVAANVPERAGLAKATGLKRDSAGRLVYLGERKSHDALAAALPTATGMDAAELKRRKLSVTHTFRHIGGEVSERLGWPEPEGNIVGEWALPSAGGEGAPPPRRAKIARKAACVRVASYAPDATSDRQLEIRTRYMRAIEAGLRHFGHGNLTFDTTWADIFLSPAPPDLAEFYGAMPK